MNTNKIDSSIIFFVLVLLLVFLFLPSIMARAGEIPKIGAIYPKTGIYSIMGPKHLDGLMLAIEDHGKLLGEKPKLFIRDNGTKLSLAMSAAHELISKQHVHIIIGCIHTPINNSIATMCDENKLPFVYPSGGGTALSGIGKDITFPNGLVKSNPHPYMFFTGVSSKQRADACIDVAKKFGKKWYFIASDYQHGRESVGFAQMALQKEFGNQFVDLGVHWEKQGAMDYTTAISKAIAAKPDVVFQCLPGRIIQFQKQAVAMGLKDVAHIHWSYAERLSAVACGEAAFGVTGSYDYGIENPDWPLSNEFARRFHGRYGYWPHSPTTTTYMAVKIFLMAIERAGSLDSGNIMKALQGIEDPKPITGKPYFIRACDHKSVQPLYTVQWTKSEEYAPGYWKIISTSKNPESVLFPCSVKAGYDKMVY